MSSSRSLASLALSGVFFALSMAFTTPGIHAQSSQAPSTSASPREACDADVKAYCPSAAGDRSKIMSCMRENEAKLAPACRAALQSAGVFAK